MLARLHIQNIAVIDEVEIEFGSGFHVLTGETGAGKSIIIDSINMVLGERTSRELIRTGAQKAVVEALFYVENKSVLNALTQMDIPMDDESLLLYREINSEGRGTCKINGIMATTAMLKEVARLLINIHGQQDSQALLQPQSHLGFLDSFAQNEMLREQYRTLYDEGRAIAQQLQGDRISDQERAQRMDLLSFQAQEIDDAKLQLGEEEELENRRAFLMSASKIANAVSGAMESLYNAEDGSVHDVLSRVKESFGEVADVNQCLGEIYNALDSIAIELDDVIFRIRDFGDELDFSPNALDQVEERLDLISRLKRKYGADIAEILAYRARAEEELESFVHNDERIAKLEEELARNRAQLSQVAKQLSDTRAKYAKELEQRIEQELSQLDMNKITFRVDQKPKDFGADGADQVEFLISTNVGEELKPLSKIASGGEMSRIMLAIKSVLADSDPVETLIFDEIDTGVSGRAAQKIAEKLHKISRKYQVVCITHLAQIAAMADRHYLIEKRVEDGHTKTGVALLDGSEREKEVARIIGGAKITDLTIKNAREMLEFAKGLK